MSWIQDAILSLSRGLYPKGRAFKMPSGGALEQLHKALGVSEAQALNDADSILYSIIPDNAIFDEDDATIWEQKLGLVHSAGTTLAVRISAILQKMAYPGTTAPRCAASYIEEQLQAAGFNVYLKENRWPAFGTYHTVTPGMILALPYGLAQYGTPQYGDTQYGTGVDSGGVTIIANHIEEAADSGFVIGSNYRATFFIGAAGLSESLADFASVPIARKDEFRQLILTLKPQQSVGFLFVNYV
jgi:hypothetical protein